MLKLNGLLTLTKLEAPTASNPRIAFSVGRYMKVSDHRFLALELPSH